MSQREPTEPSGADAKDSCGSIGNHQHSWVEGPYGHSICDDCGRAYSPIHDLIAVEQECTDLRRRIAYIEALHNDNDGMGTCVECERRWPCLTVRGPLTSADWTVQPPSPSAGSPASNDAQEG